MISVKVYIKNTPKDLNPTKKDKSVGFKMICVKVYIKSYTKQDESHDKPHALYSLRVASLPYGRPGCGLNPGSSPFKRVELQGGAKHQARRV